MVVVSHDRHLLRSTCDDLLLVHGGRVEPFNGDLDDYARWLGDRLDSSGGGTSPPPGDHTAAARRDRKRQEAEQRRLLQPFRREVERREQDLEHRLADPGLYDDARRTELRELLAEKGRLDTALAAAEAAWLSAAEELESLAGR